MSRKLKDDGIVEHIIKLRAQAAAAYELYEKMLARIEFYRKYISLGQTHNVKLGGPLMVIQGGRPTEVSNSQAIGIEEATECHPSKPQLRQTP
jgi:hypothetical protein